MLSDQNVELVQRFIRLPMQQRRVFFERLQAKGMNLSQFPIPVVRHAFEAVPLSYAQERLCSSGAWTRLARPITSVLP